MPINPEWLAIARRRSAYHEAGHAVMGMAFGCHVHSVTIPVDTDGGQAEVVPPPLDTELNLVRRVLLASAGIAAEFALADRAGTDQYREATPVNSDSTKAETDLKALGHEGLFLHYALFVSRIFQEQEYWEPLKALGEALLKLGNISDQVKLSALASQVPRMDDAQLEVIKAMMSAVSPLPVVGPVQAPNAARSCSS